MSDGLAHSVGQPFRGADVIMRVFAEAFAPADPVDSSCATTPPGCFMSDGRNSQELNSWLELGQTAYWRYLDALCLSLPVPKGCPTLRDFLRLAFQLVPRLARVTADSGPRTARHVEHSITEFLRYEQCRPRSGVLVLSHNELGERLVLVVKGPFSAKWTLPKGKMEPGETALGAALRELREETGLDLGAKVDGCIPHTDLRPFQNEAGHIAREQTTRVYCVELDGASTLAHRTSHPVPRAAREAREVEKIAWLHVGERRGDGAATARRGEVSHLAWEALLWWLRRQKPSASPSSRT